MSITAWGRLLWAQPSRHSRANGTKSALFYSFSIGQTFNVPCWALGFPFLFLSSFPRAFQGDTTSSSLCPHGSDVLKISWSFLWGCSGRRGSSLSLPAFQGTSSPPRGSGTLLQRGQRLPCPWPGQGGVCQPRDSETRAEPPGACQGRQLLAPAPPAARTTLPLLPSPEHPKVIPVQSQPCQQQTRVTSVCYKLAFIKMCAI